MRVTLDRVAAIVVGLVVAYFAWLAVMAAATFVVPPRHLVAAGAVVLAVLVAGCVAAAIVFSRRGRRVAALASWCAPAAPILASLYALLVVMN